MLLQFTVSNYKSFCEPQTLNLMASAKDKSLPENLISPKLPGLTGKKWLKGAVLYGANASGKTSFLEAMQALSVMIKDSAKLIDENELVDSIEPNAFTEGSLMQPTAFMISFVTEGIRYEYRVAATMNLVHHESLRSFDKGVERLWFVRNWDVKNKLHVFSPDSPSGMNRSKDIEGRTLRNMLYLSKANAENRSEIKPIFKWLTRDFTFLDLSTKSKGLSVSLTLKLLGDQIAGCKEDIMSLLRHASIGIEDATEKRRDPSDVELKMLEAFPKDMQESVGVEILKLAEPSLKHSIRGGLQSLDWSSESAGTQRYFALIGHLLIALKTGSTICIDELETSLHPVMVLEIIKLFFSNKTNPLGAQLIFTSHNPLCLDLNILRRDQVWFTEKDEHGEGHLYPLTDYSPRKNESLIRGYLAGRYGGIPHIPEGLFGGEFKGL